MEKEKARKRGLIEKGKRERESQRVHVIPECRKLKAPATRPLARSFVLSLAYRGQIAVRKSIYIHIYMYIYMVYIYMLERVDSI